MPPKKARAESEAKPQEKSEVKKVEEKTTAPKPTSKPVEGDSNLFGALSYVIGWLAIILYFVKKDDKFVKFHAIQSLIFNVAFVVVIICFLVVTTMVGVISGGVGMILNICLLPIALIAIIYDLYMAYQAYQGIMYKMPIVGDMAEKYAG